jgi:NADH:ubiquinone oxidoreductase subunit 3 (subunit A)
MVEVANVTSRISETYNEVFLSLPSWAQNFFNILFLIVLVTLFCIFVWKIYTLIAKKNVIKLNLNQYNKSSHPAMVKFLEVVFYFLEYIIILPFLVFFWFAAFTLFLLFLTKDLNIETLLLISTVIIVAIRATAYYREELSRELAKLLPFTLLAVSMTEKEFFNFSEILSRASQIPSFFGNIITYLIIIIVLEVILRLFDFLIISMGLKDFDEDSDEDEEGNGEENENKRKIKKTK